MAAALAVGLTVTVQAGPASAATIPENDPVSATTTATAQTQAVGQCAALSTGAGSVREAPAPEMIQLDQAASTALATSVSVLAEAAGITSHTPAEFVQREGVKAYAIDVDGVKATSVTFPIVGEHFVPPSNLTFVLDETGNLNQYSESTVVERDSGILDLTTYRDGVQVHSAELDPSTLLAAGAAEPLFAAAAISPQQCIGAVLGVGAITAGIILVLCGGSCSVPITPPTAIVCAACIGGIAAVGGASIAAVMGCFN
ncbi:hypothetical protein [Cryobacterium zhongshanensis]|uniref:Uncharacterized protein n=1 Tax=Cryobacterium zhongshanensis TaxID=2928153 RepID=A0AA41QWG9_9MICO|nr:hypothetical protein [Cryobacterium zhongshanensis]MCI4658976.1 hypothetical protein [Cryobacterium zhongshanensis]